MGEKGQKDIKKAPAEIKQSTPLQLKGKISKNQRVAGEKQIHAKRLCVKGHALTTVLVVPVKGKRRVMDVCGCNGESVYGTDTSGIEWNIGGGWMQRKDSGIPGKKRDAIKGKGSYHSKDPYA